MSPEKPEQYIYRSTEDERRFASTYLNPEEAHARAQKSLSAYEIKPETFSGLYGAEILKSDADAVEKMEASFTKSPSKIYADILEAVVCEHGELSDWFGPKSQIMKTARFDDYVNKVDMVIEIETGKQQFSHLALGIDVTFGSKDLHKKFDAIKNKIDAGTLGQVKYFHSDRQNFTGRLRKVPQVVIGVEIDKVNELGLLWMNRRNKELEDHPVQVTFLEETALQLQTFARYARDIGKIDLALILEKDFIRVSELLQQKKDAGIKGIKDDRVFEEIKRNLAAFVITP